MPKRPFKGHMEPNRPPPGSVKVFTPAEIAAKYGPAVELEMVPCTGKTVTITLPGGQRTFKDEELDVLLKEHKDELPPAMRNPLASFRKIISQGRELTPKQLNYLTTIVKRVLYGTDKEQERKFQQTRAFCNAFLRLKGNPNLTEESETVFGRGVRTRVTEEVAAILREYPIDGHTAESIVRDAIKNFIDYHLIDLYDRGFQLKDFLKYELSCSGYVASQARVLGSLPSFLRENLEAAMRDGSLALDALDSAVSRCTNLQSIPKLSIDALRGGSPGSGRGGV